MPMRDAHDSGQRVSYLDAWRGWAIISVLVGHFVVASGINFGRLGVELFFALSGSLIGDILFVKRDALAAYALKRFARIVPSLWVFLALISVGSWWFNISFPWIDVLSAGLGFANYHRPHTLTFQHLWSVSVEMQGYVVLGLVAYICRSSRLVAHFVISTLVAFSWLTVCIAALNGTLEYYSTFWRFEFRCTSMLLAAALVSYGVSRIRRLPPWWVFLFLGCLFFVDLVPDAVRYTFGSGLIAIACVQLRNAPHHISFFNNRFVAEVGLASYSVYLWQQVFFSQKAWLSKPVALTLAIMVGYAVHKILDERLHKFALRFLMRGAGFNRDTTSPARART